MTTIDWLRYLCITIRIAIRRARRRRLQRMARSRVRAR